MKKLLSLILAVLMLVGVLVVPVYADDDDAFNDGQFSEWGDPTTPDTPVEPDEPVEGSKEKPIYVAMGKAAPTSLQLKAGESIYYQLKGQVFNGYSLIVGDTEGRIAFTVDGTRYDAENAFSYLDYGVKATLEFTPLSEGIVCFTNESDTDMEEPVVVTWAMPVGTETDPLMLEDGENAISVPVAYPTYYTSYNPVAVGDYLFSISDYENFIITVDTDGAPDTTADQFRMTADFTHNVTADTVYVPVMFIIQPVGTTPDITLTITPPAKGTESNPYVLSGHDEMAAGVSGQGDGLWPVGSAGMNYDMYLQVGATLILESNSAVNVKVGSVDLVEQEDFSYVEVVTWNAEHTLDGTLEIPVDQSFFKLLFTGSDDASVKMSVRYPVGSEYNRLVLNKAQNKIHLPETGETIFAVYTAEKDGVLTITPNTVVGLGWTDAFNATTEDYENGYDYIYTDSADKKLTIPVSAGDVVYVSVCAGEDEDFIINAMDVELFVGYEGENYATITKESATAAYAKLGAKVSVKVTATGDGLTYTWYIRNDGKKTYSKSSVTSATYSTTMSSTSKDRRVYCIVTDQYGNSVQSKTFMLREAASITKEPATAAYAKKGAKVSVKITASGDGLKYAWYIKNDGKSTYSKSSITSATYSATMSSSVKGRKVYCVVTDKYGKKVQSKTFLLREAASITKEPATSAYAKNGAKASVKITASGDGLKYTWYVKDAGKTKYTKSSITKSTYSAKMSSKVNGRRIYCVVTDKYGKKVQSKTFILKKK